MPHRHTYHGLFRYLALGSAAVALLAWIGPANTAKAASQSQSAQSQASGEFAIQINDDRLTLQVARVPQVYVYGTINASAPDQFASMMHAGRIPDGSDIYLNSTGGDVHAGIALGRLLRNSAMTTHLGTPRPKLRSAAPAIKTAVCSDACAYAYLGGVYRWASAGSDRLGFPMHDVVEANQNAPDEVTAYLKDMGIDPKMLAQPSASNTHGEVWLNADQLLASGLANNGRLFLRATYRLEAGAPFLELKQTDRRGDHRITLLCKAGNIQLAAYSTIGAVQARQVIARGARAYFELNQKELQPAQLTSMSLDGDSVVLTRTYPANQLSSLVHAQALGAWVADRNDAFRYGFAYEVTGVRESLQRFYDNCQIYAPWGDGKQAP